jgi:RsiW-degrading membrane proteinase PrsW (M82 family)
LDFTLLPLAVSPVVLLVHIIWMVDRPRREPIGNVVRYVGAGVFAGALAIAAEAVIAPLLSPLADPALGWVARFAVVFVGVGLIEELSKFILVSLAARRDRALDEPFDWVVYSVSVALGFAALENLRVLWQGVGAGWARAFFAVPVHALLGTFMGYHLARAMRDGAATLGRRRLLAILEPAAWHALYDALIFQMRATEGFPAVLFLGFLAVVGLLWAIAVRRTASLWHSEQGLPPPFLAPAATLARLVRGAPGAPDPAAKQDEERP